MVVHSTVLLLAMITCFMSNQICRVCGGLWFLFDSYALPENISRQYYAILWLQSNAYLELACIHYSADTRLSSRLPIGEPGNEASELVCQAEFSDAWDGKRKVT